MSTWHVDIVKLTLHNTYIFQINYQHNQVHYIMRKLHHTTFVSNRCLTQLVPIIMQNFNHTIFILLVVQHTNGKLTKARVNIIVSTTNMPFKVTNLGFTIAHVYTLALFLHCLVPFLCCFKHLCYLHMENHALSKTSTFRLTSLPWINPNLQTGGTNTRYILPQWSKALLLILPSSIFWPNHRLHLV